MGHPQDAGAQDDGPKKGWRPIQARPGAPDSSAHNLEEKEPRALWGYGDPHQALGVCS